jgi:hypothetical protein
VNFLSPALLVGLLAAAIPPILHLIFRRKAVRVRFPSLELIRRSNRKTARRHKLQQWLLMLTRSLLLAAVAFAMARPYLEPETAAGGAPSLTGGAVSVVVDASWPMGYAQGGERLIDRARIAADRALRGLGSGGLAALVVAGAKAEAVVPEVTADLDLVRRQIEAVEVTPRLGTLGEAVARAYETLSSAPPSLPRRVVVLTTPAGAASGLPTPPPGSGIELVAVDLLEGKPPENRAVLDVQARPAPDLGPGQWRLDARIANLGAASVERLPVSVLVEGEVKVRGFVTLEPGQDTTKTFNLRLPPSATSLRAEVVIESDALEADDTRALWLSPAPELRVLAVNGDPRPIPQRDELFYFERALAPTAAATTRVRVEVARADTVDAQRVAAADVVVLANLPVPSPELARALEAYVRGGGGLLVAMGDQVQPADTNAQLGKLLPRALRDVRTAGDAAASDEGGDRRVALVTRFDRGHAILQPFVDPSRSSLARIGVARYMLLDPSPDAQGEVVLALEDGTPYLLTRPVDRGRVALLTGTLDRDWNDLPIRPDFVPLLEQVLRYLARVTSSEGRAFVVGQPAPLRVDDPTVARVVVEAPSGQRTTLDRPTDATPWQVIDTSAPGLYRVAPDPPLEGVAELPGFAIGLDPLGSDLRAARAPKDDTDGDSTPVASATAPGALGPEGRTELWHAALLGLFFLLLGEAALLHPRKTRAAG